MGIRFCLSIPGQSAASADNRDKQQRPPPKWNAGVCRRVALRSAQARAFFFLAITTPPIPNTISRPSETVVEVADAAHGGGWRLSGGRVSGGERDEDEGGGGGQAEYHASVKRL